MLLIFNVFLLLLITTKESKHSAVISLFQFAFTLRLKLLVVYWGQAHTSMYFFTRSGHSYRLHIAPHAPERYRMGSPIHTNQLSSLASKVSLSYQEATDKVVAILYFNVINASFDASSYKKWSRFLSEERGGQNISPAQPICVPGTLLLTWKLEKGAVVLKPHALASIKVSIPQQRRKRSCKKIGVLYSTETTRYRVWPSWLVWFLWEGWDWVHLVRRPLLAYCTSPGW
jgi:hypothetical protein